MFTTTPPLLPNAVDMAAGDALPSAQELSRIRAMLELDSIKSLKDDRERILAMCGYREVPNPEEPTLEPRTGRVPMAQLIREIHALEDASGSKLLLSIQKFSKTDGHPLQAQCAEFLILTSVLDFFDFGKSREMALLSDLEQGGILKGIDADSLIRQQAPWSETITLEPLCTEYGFAAGTCFTGRDLEAARAG